MAQKVLSCRIDVRDNFTTSLNKLTQNIKKSEQAFNKFSNSLDKATNKIVTNINRINTKLTAMQQKTNSVASNISNASLRQANTMQQNQERVIGNIEKRYQEMERRIIRSLNNINSNSNNTLNGGNGNNNGGNNTTNRNSGGQNGDFNNMLGQLLSGNFGSIIGKLSIIGGAITGVTAIAKSISASLDTGFDILNKATGNLFSYDGIQEAMRESMEFETGRQKLDLFYNDKGLEEYNIATKVANDTFASESQTIEIVSKLGQLGVSVNENQLRNLIDVAGTRPSVSTEHIGLAMQEALEGRVAMLKLYGINNAKLQEFYKELKKSDPSKYKELKGALNKKGTAGDPQKYFDLVNAYIEQSPMHNYADKYMETVQGKLERLSGIIQKAKAEIMGIDTSTGLAKKNGAFEAFSKAVDTLKNKLDDPTMQAKFETIGEGFAKAIGSIADSVIYLLDNINWEEFAKNIKEVGQSIADIIKRLSDSGVLKQFADTLPTNTKKIINNQVIKAETEVKTQNDLVNGDLFGYVGDKVNGIGDRIINFFNPEAYEESKKEIYTDADLKNMIAYAHMANKITTEQENELANLVKNDNVEKYEIHIGQINANNFNEILESIKQASKNRK